ncbi:MAG: hypothetical protein ACKPJJ_34675, partial [Planctomycetaceae bacterium]
YQRLITKIQTDTAPEEAILAGPDCPEVYFLSGRRNPTRVFYDFFQPDLLKTDAELNELASRERIRMVVVKQPFLREFSRDTPPLESWARAHFGPPITLGFIGRIDSDAPRFSTSTPTAPPAKLTNCPLRNDFRERENEM